MCLVVSVHLSIHPSIYPSIPLSIHLSLGIHSACISQGICKELINKIISPQKLKTKVSLWKTSRKINSSSFSSSCSCGLTLSPPSLQLGSWLFVQFCNGDRACMHWDVGGRGGGKASQGLTTFLNSFACLI